VGRIAIVTTTFYARGDSSSANNAALNAQGTNKVAVTTLEFQAAAGGDIILEYNGDAADPDTVVLVDGVEMTFTVEFSGTLPLYNKLGNVNGEDLRSSEGNVKVEDLRVGYIVTTLSGSKELCWIGVRHISACQLQDKPHFRPVIIQKDALGIGCPLSDLSVSPNHRVLLSGWHMELSFASEAMLCAAKHLVNNTTITTNSSATSAEYYHLMFDEHEIVFSNGLATESLLGGAMTATIGSAAAEYEFKELLGIRASLETRDTPAAYPLMRHYVAKMVQPHLAA